jgi:hypothetical protein
MYLERLPNQIFDVELTPENGLWTVSSDADGCCLQHTREELTFAANQNKPWLVKNDELLNRGQTHTTPHTYQSIKTCLLAALTNNNTPPINHNNISSLITSSSSHPPPPQQHHHHPWLQKHSPTNNPHSPSD